MSKSRMISEEFFQSESVAEWTIRQRLLIVGMIANADDQGRIRGHPRWLRSRIFPYDIFTAEDIEEDLQTISEANDTVLVYEIKGKRYIQLKNWWEYQKLQWAKTSELPAPDGWVDRIRLMIYKPRRWVMTINWADTDDCLTYKDVLSGKKSGNDTADPPPITKTETKEVVDSKAEIEQRRLVSELANFQKHFKILFPKKPQPRKKTISKNFKTRIKEQYFYDNWLKALGRASESSLLHKKRWFTALWFLQNDKNWEKCLDGNYDNDPDARQQNREIIERGAQEYINVEE